MRIAALPNGDLYVMNPRPKGVNPFKFRTRARGKKAFMIYIGEITVPSQLAKKKFMFRVEMYDK